MDTSEVHLDEPIRFIGVIFRNVGEGLLTGAEMTLTAMSPKPTQAWMTVHKARNLEHTV